MVPKAKSDFFFLLNDDDDDDDEKCAEREPQLRCSGISSGNEKSMDAECLSVSQM